MDANKEVDRRMPRLLGADGDLQYCCRRYRVIWDYGCRLVFPKYLDNRRIQCIDMKDYEFQREMDVQCFSSCFMCFRNAIKRELEGFADEFFPFLGNLDLSSGA